MNRQKLFLRLAPMAFGSAMLMPGLVASADISDSPVLDVEKTFSPTFMPAFLSSDSNKTPYYISQDSLAVYDSDFAVIETHQLQNEVFFDELKYHVTCHPAILKETKREESPLISDGWGLDQTIDFLNNTSPQGADSYTIEQQDGGYIFYPTPIESNEELSFFITKNPYADGGGIYNFQYKYPKRFARLTSEGTLMIGTIEYDTTGNYEAQEVILRQGDEYHNGYQLAVMAYASGNNSCERTQTHISQNFFNDDDNYELIQSKYALIPRENKEYDRYLGEVTILDKFASRTGLDIVSADGRVLESVDLGDASINGDIEMLMLEGKKYLSFSVWDKGSTYYRFYRVESPRGSATSLHEMPVRMKASPNPARTSEPVEIDLGSTVRAEATIHVTSTDGRSYAAGSVKAGESKARIDISGLTPGLYIVSADIDGTRRESCRILVR